MTQKKQTAPLSRAMDGDSGDKYINTAQGFVRERVNLRINELDGNSLFNCKLKGNLLIDCELPAGTNKCIGWCPDHKTKSILWFVWNSGITDPGEVPSGIVDSYGNLDGDLTYARAVELGYVGSKAQYISDVAAFWVTQVGGDVEDYDGTYEYVAIVNTNAVYPYQVSIGYAGNYDQWLGSHWTYDQWFTEATAPKHSILKYSINAGTVQKVIYAQSGLGLEDAFLSACVAEGRVSWVNGQQQPKSFNIERAINFTNSLEGEKYESFDFLASDILPLIKRPPQFAPTVYYASILEDEDGLPINFNNLRGKLFQFKYNFVYEDNQESAYSEISKIPLPEGDLTAAGEWVAEFSTNNCISLDYFSGGSTVRKINFAACIAGDQSAGDFNLFKTIEKFDSDGERLLEDDAQYSINFLNNGNIRNINTDINSRYCDDVPLSASSITLLAGKYLAMSMPRKGYEPVLADLTLAHSWADVEYGVGQKRLRSVRINNVTKDEAVWEVFFDSDVVLNSKYGITIVFGDNTSVTGSVSVTDSNPGAESIRDSIYNNLFSDPRLSADGFFESNKYGFSVLIHVKNVPGATQIKSYAATVTSGSTPSFKSFKRAQYHRIGMVYNDEFGRYNIVNNETSIYVPAPEYDMFAENYDSVSKLSFSINHRPPEWAYSYRFVYSKDSSYNYFINMPGIHAVEGGNDNIPAGHTFLKFNQAIQLYRETNSNVSMSDYVWVKGDKCRCTYLRSAQDAVFEISPFIRKYKSTADIDEIEDGFIVKGEFVLFTHASGTKHVDIEIFRPNYEFSGNIFYETGDSYPILNPGTAGRSHAANTIDQSDDLLTPATGVLLFGDVYLRRRVTSELMGSVEDMSYSDFYPSLATDIGRAVIKITGGSEQKTLHRVVRSENFIEGSEYNLLNVFLPQTEFFTVSQSYGPVTRIAEAGDVLKVVQEHKETSVYIGKTSVKQADGTSMVLISDRVFGSSNPSEKIFGSRFPRSIAVNGRNLYYFDSSTGDFIRSAPNGQISISEFYNMKSYFKQKAEQIRASTEVCDVIVSIDSNYDEVLITFIVGQTSETICFYEKEELKGFIYKAYIKPYSGTADGFAWYGNKSFGFLAGKLYESHAGPLNTFFGNLVGAHVSFVVNAGADSANKFSDIEISSPDNAWDVTFDIESGMNYPAQKSILRPTIIRAIENRLYSPILRNILGRDGIQHIDKLRNGSQMTGETMKVTVSNSTSEDNKIKEVEVKFLTS